MVTLNREVFEAMGKTYLHEDAHWGDDTDVIKTSIEHLLAEGPVRWTDVGCGPGFHMAEVGKLYSGMKIAGIDFSRSMLKEARKRCALARVPVALEELDICHADLDGGQRLITLMNNVLGNICMDGTEPAETRQTVIRKIAESLAPGGHFILSVYNRERLDLEAYGAKSRVVEGADAARGDLHIEFATGHRTVRYYSHWFTEEEIRKLLEVADLKVDLLERRSSRFVIRCRKT